VALPSWMLNIVVHPATGRVNDHSMKHCKTCWFWLSSRYNFLRHERARLKLTRAYNIETVTHSCTAECSSLWSLLLQVAYFKKSCKGNKSWNLAWLIFPYSCLRGDLEEGYYAELQISEVGESMVKSGTKLVLLPTSKTASMTSYHVEST